MAAEQQDQVPIYNEEQPSEESVRLRAIFDDLERRGPHTIDAFATRCGGWALFLFLVGFAGLLLSQSLREALASHPLEKALLLGALLSYLAALLAQFRTVRPRLYDRYEFNVTRLGEEFKKIVRFKMRWARLTALSFALGTVLLAVLICALVIQA
jgi:hypothetical protein